MEKAALAGEYYLRGIMETASGFLLEPDGHFRFFLSYGALDRHGTGTWVTNGNQVVLNSTKKPEKDFAFTGTARGEHEEVLVRVNDKNPIFLQHVYASLAHGAEGSWRVANKYGEIIFPKQDFSTICLLLDICPEKYSVFNIGNKGMNEFSFRFEPWIMEVFFNGFVLETEQEGLYGPHPLLKPGIYHYRR